MLRFSSWISDAGRKVLEFCFGPTLTGVLLCRARWSLEFEIHTRTLVCRRLGDGIKALKLNLIGGMLSISRLWFIYK